MKYVIHPSGKPPSFAWHLEWPDFHLFLGKSPTPKGKNPNGLVAFNSRALWSLGVPGVVQLVAAVITDLGRVVHGWKPSRVDLASDFLLPVDLRFESLRAMRVPSHMKHSAHLDGDQLETFYHGEKSSPIQLRIYNKGEEILKGRTKFWFLQVWNLTSGKHVWRVEFQVRRQALRQLKFETLDDLEQKLGGLWEYLTSWFSLRLPDNRNSTRRTVHPWWQAVAACAEKFGPAATVERSFEGEPADSSWYVSHCAGCLASFAACEGLNNLNDSAALMMARIQNYWRSRQFRDAVTMKSIRLGTPLNATETEVLP